MCTSRRARAEFVVFSSVRLHPTSSVAFPELCIYVSYASAPAPALNLGNAGGPFEGAVIVTEIGQHVCGH